METLNILEEIVYGILATHILILAFVGYGIWIEVYDRYIHPRVMKWWYQRRAGIDQN